MDLDVVLINMGSFRKEILGMMVSLMAGRSGLGEVQEKLSLDGIRMACLMEII